MGEFDKLQEITMFPYPILIVLGIAVFIGVVVSIASNSKGG